MYFFTAHFGHPHPCSPVFLTCVASPCTLPIPSPFSPLPHPQVLFPTGTPTTPNHAAGRASTATPSHFSMSFFLALPTPLLPIPRCSFQLEPRRPRTMQLDGRRLQPLLISPCPFSSLSQHPSSPSPGALSNWNPDDPEPCSWTGVDCNPFSFLHVLFPRSPQHPSSPSPGALDNWNPNDPDPCSWTGVDCNPFSRRVTSLSLPYRTLSGTLDLPDPSLASLSDLLQLSLPGNSFPGSFPSALSRLSSLQTLELAETELSGEIPGNTLSALRRVAVLDLRKNALSGPIPRKSQLSTP
ncbi:unnamed protein product [Closterium sp. NIES-64]|nr:unnamed protein product [Closterium sp. NIES-64]